MKLRREFAELLSWCNYGSETQAWQVLQFTNSCFNCLGPFPNLGLLGSSCGLGSVINFEAVYILHGVSNVKRRQEPKPEAYIRRDLENTLASIKNVIKQCCCCECRCFRCCCRCWHYCCWCCCCRCCMLLLLLLLMFLLLLLLWWYCSCCCCCCCWFFSPFRHWRDGFQKHLFHYNNRVCSFFTRMQSLSTRCLKPMTWTTR